MTNEEIVMEIDANGLSRRQIMLLSAIAGGISFAGPVGAQLGGLGRIGKAVGAAGDLVKAENISDAELNSYFGQIAQEYDRVNPVASPKSKYGKRIAALSKGMQNYDGLNLDIKAYEVADVNAFAMGNGTIRVFAGLMDKFTDDEIRYVIGHEIGHVKKGHSKKRMQSALRTSALQKGASAAGGTVARIASSDLTKMFGKVVSAQHSQGSEKEADDYALGFMKAKGFAPMACVTALDKLSAMGGGGGGLPWLQTHPSPEARSKRMRTALGA
jgi:metalloprotease